MIFFCRQCKEKFERNNSHRYIYCSRRCQSFSQVGKPTKRFDKIKRKGYWYIHLPEHPNKNSQGYFPEHRLVMEKHLGRFLKRYERVHHINHNITDNRIENLMLFANNGDHLKYGHADLKEKYRIDFKGKHFSPASEFRKI